MVRARLDGINTTYKKLKSGERRVYYYHRATGERLHGKPGSSQFLSDYAAAEKLLTDRNAGTVSGLIRDYALSPEFGLLAASTQKEYGRKLTAIEQAFGTMPTAALNDPKVRSVFMRWRATVAETSGARESDYRMSVLSAMISWGMDNVGVEQNHLRGFKRLHRVDRSEKIWLPEHIAAFKAVAPIEMHRALDLALHTGLRQGDIRQLTWANYQDGWIVLRKGRKRKKVEIPATKALVATLASIPREHALILTTRNGHPWQKRYFSSQWKKASDDAGILDLNFHDLRGTAVTMLAEAGCNTAEIASITGHTFRSASSILDRYTARTRALAGQAIARIENRRTTKFANQVQTGGADTIQEQDK
ncbi:MAG: tyrosine-type recombinase/integrase [Pseudomonadota bacterium]